MSGQKSTQALPGKGRPCGAVPGDLAALALVGAPSAAPGGGWVAAAVQSMDPDLARYHSRLWRFQAGRQPRPLTPDDGAWSDTSPSVSPDGSRIAFRSDRDRSGGVWLVPAEGGVPAAIEAPEGRPVEMAWLADDRLLVLYERREDRRASAPVVVDWLRYKSDGAKGPVEPRNELWLLATGGGGGGAESGDGGGGGESAGGGGTGAPVLLRQGGDDRRLSCLVPDGRGGVYYASHPRHSDEPFPGGEVHRLDLETGHDAEVWRCASAVRALTVTGSGRPVALASGEPGQSAEPPRVWWADEGRRVFPDQDLECERAVLGDCRPLGAPRLLAAVGERIVFLATVDGEAAVYAGEGAPVGSEGAGVGGAAGAAASAGGGVGVPAGAGGAPGVGGAAGARPGPGAADAGPGTGAVGVARRISPVGQSVVDFCLAGDDSLALCLESATLPVELYLNGARLSDLNTAWAAEVSPVAPEEVTVTSADGLELRGLLYRSAIGGHGGDVLLRVHGGPHMTFGNTFDLETQAYVAAGFHVLVPGVRGGAGLGTEFRSLSVRNWGRGDVDDLMAFADWAVETRAAAPDRLYLAGGSYGGYLINWTVTRTGRFRAAVSERSVSNLVSKYGTSDNGFTVNRYEFGGLDLFGADATELWERSPLSRVADVTTPLLLVHGEDDQRCPIEQSEQFFTALRRLGREVVFARYPGGSHGFATAGRPEHRLHRLELILDWLRGHAARD